MKKFYLYLFSILLISQNCLGMEKELTHLNALPDLNLALEEEGEVPGCLETVKASFEELKNGLSSRSSAVSGSISSAFNWSSSKLKSLGKNISKVLSWAYKKNHRLHNKIKKAIPVKVRITLRIGAETTLVVIFLHYYGAFGSTVFAQHNLATTLFSLLNFRRALILQLAATYGASRGFDKLDEWLAEKQFTKSVEETLENGGIFNPWQTGLAEVALLMFLERLTLALERLVGKEEDEHSEQLDLRDSNGLTIENIEFEKVQTESDSSDSAQSEVVLVISDDEIAFEDIDKKESCLQALSNNAKSVLDKALNKYSALEEFICTKILKQPVRVASRLLIHGGLAIYGFNTLGVVSPTIFAGCKFAEAVCDHLDPKQIPIILKGATLYGLSVGADKLDLLVTEMQTSQVAEANADGMVDGKIIWIPAFSLWFGLTGLEMIKRYLVTITEKEEPEIVPASTVGSRKTTNQGLRRRKRNRTLSSPEPIAEDKEISLATRASLQLPEDSGAEVV